MDTRTTSIIISIIMLTLLAGCGSNDIDRRPCAEQIPCPQPAENTYQGKNISSDHWTSLGLEDESVSAIAVHPCNPGIIYAGTQFNFSAGTRGKLLKTTDCGATRDTLAVGGSYRTIQLQPGNPDVVYAVNGSILKTTNAGQSWQQAREGIELDSETGVGSLAINPQNACVLYAGTAWSGDVLRSTSGGNRWEPTGLVDTGSIVDELLVGSQDNKVIAGIRFKGFFYSVNRGSSWMPLTEIIKGDEFSTNKLIISPENNLKMYSTIKRLAHQSEDGGKNWFKQVGIDSLNNVQVKTISSEGEFLFGFSQNQGLTIIKTN